MKRLGKDTDAIGFALYLNEIILLEEEESKPDTFAEEDGFITVALPKGRLGDAVYGMFDSIGYGCHGFFKDSRKLVFENPEKKVRFLLVKPGDVAIYVERMVADVGVLGKDVLLETNPDVYELMDLGVGKCRMATAAPRGFVEDMGRPLRVATKYVNIAKDYYSGLNREVDLIKLNGSMELAPILKLSDVIVDVVETGNTLKENDLVVIEEFRQISARFIANKSSFKFKSETISSILRKLEEIVK
jgi:ATP phosphoribosyltransferase